VVIVFSPQTIRLLRTIKDVVTNEALKEGVKVKNIILFGSRARGDYGEDSDWDLLIIVGGSPDRKTMRRLQYRVYRALSRNKIYCDVIVVSEEYYVKYRNVVGTIAYYAHLEGRRVE
jgi:predicted nucleotidyltransferase